MGRFHLVPSPCSSINISVPMWISQLTCLSSSSSCLILSALDLASSSVFLSLSSSADNPSPASTCCRLENNYVGSPPATVFSFILKIILSLVIKKHKSEQVKGNKIILLMNFNQLIYFIPVSLDNPSLINWYFTFSFRTLLFSLASVSLCWRLIILFSKPGEIYIILQT